jgi:hypothetical protein
MYGRLIRGVQVLFGHEKQQNPPVGSGLPWLKPFALGCSTLVITNDGRILEMATNSPVVIRGGSSRCITTVTRFAKYCVPLALYPEHLWSCFKR